MLYRLYPENTLFPDGLKVAKIPQLVLDWIFVTLNRILLGLMHKIHGVILSTLSMLRTIQKSKAVYIILLIYKKYHGLIYM